MTHRTHAGIAVVVVSAAFAAQASCRGQIVLDFEPDAGADALCANPSCVRVIGPPGGTNPNCPAPASWLPVPPSVPLTTPAPHPDSECPFYQDAYQAFLTAMAPSAAGAPALVSYPTPDDAFLSRRANSYKRNTGDLAPSGAALAPSQSPDPYVNPGGASAAATVRQGPPTGRAWLGNVRQGGERNVLVDQDHHAIYYGLHMNQAFVDFIQANGLQTVNGILNVDPNLELSPGLAEFQSAWKDIDPRDFPDANGKLGTPNGIIPPPSNVYASDPGDYSNYITTMAWLTWLRQDAATGAILEDPDHPVLRKVALVAVHCAFTLPGHPELVWSTFQHVNILEADPGVQKVAGLTILGAPDTQPYAVGPMLPPIDDPQNNLVTEPLLAAGKNMLLCSGGTPERAANQPFTQRDLKFDAATQSFLGQSESLYRVFAGSESATLATDFNVYALNASVAELFTNAIAAGAIDRTDGRQHYRLVGAIWLDKPAFFGLGAAPSGGAPPGMVFQNDNSSPLVLGAEQLPPDIFPDISEGTFCGTPLNAKNLSGDDPSATAQDNTAPGCVTRADALDVPGAHAPVTPPANPLNDFGSRMSGKDSPFSLIGGEDRLSGVATESFMQSGVYANCLTCHNTQPIATVGTPWSSPAEVIVLPRATKINVSHLFSQFVQNEQALGTADGGP